MRNVNRLATRPDIEQILNRLGNIGDGERPLTINSLEPYQKAFVHKSYVNEPDPHLSFAPKKSNEVLEFLGDSFIGAVVAKYLVDRFEDEQEGFLTKVKTRLVRTSMLHRFARFLMIGTFILLSPQFERLTAIGSNKGRNNPRLYEDCFEAFVGAIIVDFGDEEGYKYVKRFLIAIIEHLVDFADLILQNENFKDTLQRYFQSMKWPNPVYIDLYESGPSHMREFYKGVFLKREHLFTLDKHVVKDSMVYHEHVLRNSPDKVSQAVMEHADKNDCVLIGLGKANKKNEAEQQCSNIGLCCLNISSNW